MGIKTIAALFMLTGLTSLAQTKKSPVYFMVSGKVSLTADYCGGARPSEEMLGELNKPKPYTGKILYIRKGEVNDVKQPIVSKITIDSTGKFSLMLPPGTYCIIQAEQKDALNPAKLQGGQNTVIDKNCVKDWWKKPYHVLHVKDKNITGLDFTFRKRCFVSGDIPCITYTGPYPP